MKETTKTLPEAVIERVNQLMGGQIQTLYSLADFSGVPYPTLKSLMQGRTKGITLKTVFMIAHAFNKSVSEFFDSDIFRYENFDLGYGIDLL